MTGEAARMVNVLIEIDLLVHGSDALETVPRTPEVVLERVRAYVARSEEREATIRALAKSMGGGG